MECKILYLNREFYCESSVFLHFEVTVMGTIKKKINLHKDISYMSSKLYLVKHVYYSSRFKCFTSFILALCLCLFANNAIALDSSFYR